MTRKHLTYERDDSHLSITLGARLNNEIIVHCIVYKDRGGYVRTEIARTIEAKFHFDIDVKAVCTAIEPHFVAQYNAFLDDFDRFVTFIHEFIMRWSALCGKHLDLTLHETYPLDVGELLTFYGVRPLTCTNFTTRHFVSSIQFTNTETSCFIADTARHGMRLSRAMIKEVFDYIGYEDEYSQSEEMFIALYDHQERVYRKVLWKIRKFVHFSEETTANRLYTLVKRADVLHNQRWPHTHLLRSSTSTL